MWGFSARSYVEDRRIDEDICWDDMRRALDRRDFAEFNHLLRQEMVARNFITQDLAAFIIDFGRQFELDFSVHPNCRCAISSSIERAAHGLKK